MAKLEKRGARKPIIERGGYWLSDNVDWSDRSNPVNLYCLTVQEGAGWPKPTEFTLSLTEDEMISVATEWLARYARGRERKRQKEIDDARKQREFALREARHSGVSTPEAG